MKTDAPVEPVEEPTETGRERIAYVAVRDRVVDREAAADAGGSRDLPGCRGRSSIGSHRDCARRSRANQARVLGRPVDDPFVRANTREAFRRYARYWFDSFAIEEWNAADVLDAFSGTATSTCCGARKRGTGHRGAAASRELGRERARHGRQAASGGGGGRAPPARTVVPACSSGSGSATGSGGRARRAGGVGKALTSALADGKLIGLLADRDLTGRGIEVEMFGARRRLPAGPALLAMSTGAPVVVVGTYQTPAAGGRSPGRWRCRSRTGDRRADATAITRVIAHAFERLISASPADWHVFEPALAGRRRLMRVALACPYAWDDPGGVQVHIRELAERLRERGHEVVVLAPTREPPSAAWVISVGPARRHPLQRFQRADRPPTVVTADGPPRTRDVRARRGPRAPADRPVHGAVGDARGARARGGHLPFGRPRARGSTTLPRRCSRRAAAHLTVRIAVSERAAEFERAADRRRVPGHPQRGRHRAVRRRRRRPTSAPGRKLLFVGRLDERKGFPVAVGAFAGSPRRGPTCT